MNDDGSAPAGSRRHPATRPGECGRWLADRAIAPAASAEAMRRCTAAASRRAVQAGEWQGWPASALWRSIPTGPAAFVRRLIWRKHRRDLRDERHGALTAGLGVGAGCGRLRTWSQPPARSMSSISSRTSSPGRAELGQQKVDAKTPGVGRLQKRQFSLSSNTNTGLASSTLPRLPPRPENGLSVYGGRWRHLAA